MYWFIGILPIYQYTNIPVHQYTNLMTTLTLELPPDVYKSAKQLADSQRRPVEQVIVEYIHLPQVEEPVGSEIDGLDDEELLQAVEMQLPATEVAQMQQLLDWQQIRPLTHFEREKLLALVELEGEITIRKAYALLEASKRGILPDHLRP